MASFTRTAALALLSACVAAQNFSLAVQSSNASINARTLSLYHVVAGGSYLVAGSPAQVSAQQLTPSSFFFGPSPRLTGNNSAVLQTNGIFTDGTAVNCAVDLFTTTNAGPLFCGVEVSKTGYLYDFGSDTRRISVAGIANFWLCNTYSTDDFQVNNTVVGSLDGKTPSNAISPNGKIPWFADCTLIDGITTVPVSSSPGAPVVSSSSATGSSIMVGTSAVNTVTRVRTTTTLVVGATSVVGTVTRSASGATTPASVRIMTSSIPLVSQISDGQIQATTPASAPPVMFTGAASMFNARIADVGAILVGAAAFVMV